jgi:hypothetical protein
VNPKRRWLLAAVAVGVMAVAVWFASFRENPKDDLPRLVVLRREQVNGRKVVVFRIDAPPHRKVTPNAMSTLNAFTGEKRAAFFPTQYMSARAGHPEEFWVVAPVDDVWRFRCEVVVESPSPSAEDVVERVKGCWRLRSFAPLRLKTFESMQTLESEPVTNAVPRTAEAPWP